MKKFFLTMVAVVLFPALMSAQSSRQLRAWYDGAIIWQRDASLVDSLNFFVNTTTGDNDNTGSDEACGEIDENAQICVGVVAFNQVVTKLPITSDTDSAKTFISALTNANDFTAFAYAASQGNKMFDASCLPEFDKIFMLNFSDGTDNYSSSLWYYDTPRRIVQQANVYDTTRYDLAQRANLNSYALGFGDDTKFRTHMQKVVLGSGTYKNATTSADLQATFNGIAQSIIASAKNVVLKTTPAIGTKYIRFCFQASNGVKDTICAQIDGFPDTGYTLTIMQEGKYARFDTPVTGGVDAESGKVLLPLNNLKFVYNGEELQNSCKIEVSYDNDLYYEDVEDASTAEAVSKRIAVVLVLDCSKSMGDAFTPMKNAAIDFIETLEDMDPDADDNGGTTGGNTGGTLNNNGHEYVDLGLPSGLLWATCNVGATAPEEYGDYFAWGETTTKSEYTSENYTYTDDVLPLSADAAAVNWGGDWRMPTSAEFDELLSSCTWTWTSSYNGTGRAGYIVKSKVTGNTNSIFLPAAGHRDGASLYSAGTDGRYWSSSYNSSSLAGSLNFTSSNRDTYVTDCFSGQSVRPVCSAK